MSTTSSAEQTAGRNQGQTVTGAVATQETTPAAMVKRYEPDFAQVLPSHVAPELFVRLAQGLLARNPDLLDAANRNRNSFLAALLECARLGHEPGTDQFALVPFKTRDAPGGVEVVGIEQYQGEIERMYRAGGVTAIKCEIVRANDDYKPNPLGVPHHEYDPFGPEKDRGDLYGVYAYAVMQSGAVSQVVQMGAAEIGRHREVAKTKKIWDGPFKASMWKKTAIHELEKWVPTSAEYRREQLRAAVEADNLRQRTVEQAAPVGALPGNEAVSEARPDNVDEDGVIHEAELIEVGPEHVDGGK
jgi:recombination protein RecT